MNKTKRVVLGASLILNVLLVVLCIFLFSHTLWGVKLRWRLVTRQPDFAQVEQQVNSILARPEFADWYTLTGFEKGQWIATFTVTHESDPSGKIKREKLNLLTSQIEEDTGLPCWPKGWVPDPTNRAIDIGEYCVIGYGILEPGFK